MSFKDDTTQSMNKLYKKTEWFHTRLHNDGSK